MQWMVYRIYSDRSCLENSGIATNRNFSNNLRSDGVPNKPRLLYQLYGRLRINPINIDDDSGESKNQEEAQEAIDR